MITYGELLTVLKSMTKEGLDKEVKCYDLGNDSFCDLLGFVGGDFGFADHPDHTPYTLYVD